MQWTTAQPAGPGWYWHRRPNDPASARVVQVSDDPMGLVVHGLPDEGDLTLRTVAAYEQSAGEWAGPITEPTS